MDSTTGTFSTSPLGFGTFKTGADGKAEFDFDIDEFGAEDLSGSPIEEMVPDYSILDQIDYKYPVHDAYFGYASRGCVRKCSFCGVPKLEGAQREMPPLASLVNGVDAAHGLKKDLVLMDNNITASARYKEVIAEIRDLGFERGAKLRRGDRSVKRRVDFNRTAMEEACDRDAEVSQRAEVLEGKLERFKVKRGRPWLGSVAGGEISTYRKVFSSVARAAGTPRTALRIIEDVLKQTP